MSARALVALVLLLGSVAHADSPRLDAARAALDNIAYDDAAKLLAEALHAGGNAPAELTEIYRLMASTSIVLGDHEGARDAYRRWLALDPKASLPSTAAVKFQDPFIAAQAYTTTNGPLAVKIGVADDGTIAVAIQSDPLKLAVSAALDGASTPTPFGNARRITLRVPARAAAVRVLVFDAHGNQLVARSFATLSAIPAETVIERPLYRRWPLWAVAAVVVGGTGGYFRYRAHQRNDELGAIEDGMVFFDEAKELERRRDRDANIATGLFVGAGALAATAVVMYLVQPKGKPVVTPMVEGGTGISLLQTF